MIRNAAAVVLAVLVIGSLAAIVPTAHALPDSEIYRVWYDANADWQGDRFVSCSGSTSANGTSIGAQWLEIESTHCETSEYSHTIYARCNNTWVGVSYVGAPCP